ncbi:unnamed protein product [Chironomus riparius]|uniref:Carbonic anhydrase n=1 Tax=Chironomus riparius TaxID=315576 RepID=A0A9N9RJ51_9DIPT|nr:unnamed protein product [Chironomus riparius]
MSHDWGYTTENGPEKWHEKFPLANGIRQSPVNIITSLTKQSTDLQVNPLRWTYVPENVKCLINPGYCWRVDVNAKGSELTGGPLNDDKYVIEQFHCHWGCSDGRGSEHTVDGQSFSAELHIVHWNSSKYNSFQEAAGHPDGLAVLGVFLKVGSEHEELDQIARLMPYIGHKGDRITLKSVDIAKFLPENKAYWTYEGSLTTPPFNESVTWILFKEPMYVSSEQITLFRELRRYDVNDECPCNEQNWLVYDSVEEDPGKIVNNFRPPLELGNRELREVGEH